MTKEQITTHLKDAFGLEDSDAADLFDSYKSTVIENFDKFAPLLAEKKFEDLTRVAHSIKGCALNCGDDEMAATAKAVEFAARTANITDIDRKFEAVGKLAEKLK